jgi:tRNA (guanine-N(7)-)-methyltransferase subunit TRM82
VSALHILSFDHSSLISGGGDPVLKIWDWMTGVVKHEVSVLEIVEPFIAVRALKRKRGQAEDDGTKHQKARKERPNENRVKKEIKRRSERQTEAMPPLLLWTSKTRISEIRVKKSRRKSW